MSYWLLKTEPDEFSIDDLEANKGAEMWDGIRNYQARNILRDDIQVGDKALIYHSSCKNVGVAGVASVVRSAYPCPRQFKASDKYFDEKSTKDNPRWFVIDVAFEEKFTSVLPLKQIKQEPTLSEMVLVRQGRLSVQPVSAKEFNTIIRLAKQ